MIKELHWIVGRTAEEVIKGANLIKKSGMKCTDIGVRPIVETATGKPVYDMYELTFEGTWWQCRKACKIIDKLELGK